MTNYLHRMTLGILATMTAAVMLGQTKLPYRQTFDDVSDFESFLVADENNDEATWFYDDIMQAAKCERNDNADDWLITPVFELEKGKTYRLAFRTYTEIENPETLEIYMGNGRRVSALTTCIMPATSISSSRPTTLTAIFVPEETDDYRIGFHHCTKGDPYFNFLYIDDLTLEETISQAAPATVADLIVTPGEKGALSATVSLRTPQMTIDNQPLTQLDKVDLYRDNQLIHTFSAPGLDTVLTYNDTEGLTNGMHTYKAVAINSAGSSSPTETSAYIGIDVPGPVENLHFAYDYDTHQATVTWDAPTKGLHGGYIDNTRLKYSLRKYPLTSEKTITDPISETRYEETVDIEWLIAAAEERYREAEEQYGIPVAHTIVIDGQGLMYYYVKAVSDIGEGAEATSEIRIIGQPYQLPFEESFSNGGSAHYWYKPVTELRNRWYSMSDNRFSQDGDSGFLAYTVSFMETEGGVVSSSDTAFAQTGRLDISSASTPVISLYYFYPYAMDNPLKVQVSDDGLNFTTIAELDTSDETLAGQYVRAIVPLTGIQNPRSCFVGFESTLTNTAEFIFLDNISIYDQVEHDLTASFTHLPSHLRSGETRNVKVGVSNLGEVDVAEGAYTVETFVDGRQCGSAQGMAVKVGQTVDIVVPTTAYGNMGDTCSVYAMVVYSRDLNTTNNKTAVESVKVKKPSFPIPQQLELAGATLQWKAPQPPRSVDEKIVESFEDYPDFTISDLGDWILVDRDNHLTYSWGDDYNWPNRTQPHAFIVMTPSEVELANGGKGLTSSWQAHSGAKMLMSSSSYQADDWLISPELSGMKQTISFYARGTNSYSESFEVLFSITDDEPESFQSLGQAVTFKSASWKGFSYDLPEGARYFAIRKVTDDGFMFFVDDISFVPETHARQDVTLLGYNVYCNGEQLNEALVTGTTFSDPVGRDAATYIVTAVYDKGESAGSNKVSLVDGIAETPATAAPDTRFYDLLGRPATSLHKGVYIQGGKKVVIK